VTAPAPFTDDQLVDQLRGYLTLVTGHGMHVTVRGDQLRAILRRVDTPAPTNGTSLTAVDPWQEPLSGVLRIVAEIIEDHSYGDLCGTNLVDALHAWAARNSTRLDPAALTAVSRALSGE
jgi:hypothetical protein